MKSDQLTELELFRLAVATAGASLAGDQRLLSGASPVDVMIDRIRDCHSAIQASLDELAGKGSHAEQ